MDERVEVTRRLAEFVAALPEGLATARAAEEVRRALLDLAGVTVVGSTEPAAALLREYALGQVGPGAAALIGGGSRTSPSMAALVNGTAGHAFDFDDIGVRAGHASVAMMPAVLAIAEHVGASGAAFTDAMVIGYEIANRLTRLYDDSTDGPYAFGYHKPSTYAVFGGTAAACRLLQLAPTQIQHAFGIAASQAGGLRINFGTMTKPMHAGNANRTAVEASLLASSGFTAATTAIEGRFGWFDVLCRQTGELDRIVEDLGARFAIEEGFRYKMYPSCGANHYAIEGVLRLLDEHRLVFADLESVVIEIGSRNLNDVLVYPWPRTGLEGKFSLAYNVAAALIDRAVTMQTFSDDKIAGLEPARSMITAIPVAGMPSDGAIITMTTKDGRRLRREQYSVAGNLEDPLPWEALVAKFTANTAELLRSADTAEAVRLIADLQDQPTLRGLTDRLIGSA